MNTGIVIGALIGIIVVMGLGLGLKSIMEAQLDEKLSNAKRRWLYLKGGVLLVGQFFAAIAMLWWGQTSGADNLEMGLSLFGGGTLGFVAIIFFIRTPDFKAGSTKPQ